MSTCTRALFLILSLSFVVSAQEPPTPTPTPTPSATPAASPSPGASATPTPGEAPTPRDPMSTPTFNGLRFRSIGPAFTSGRVIGFAVDPKNPARYFVGVASGGVWR